MTEPKDIAARLSDNQKDAFRFLSVKAWDFGPKWSVSVGYGLKKLGLVSETIAGNKYYITPLGLAVQKVLQGN